MGLNVALTTQSYSCCKKGLKSRLLLKVIPVVRMKTYVVLDWGLKSRLLLKVGSIAAAKPWNISEIGVKSKRGGR